RPSAAGKLGIREQQLSAARILPLPLSDPGAPESARTERAPSAGRSRPLSEQRKIYGRHVRVPGFCPLQAAAAGGQPVRILVRGYPFWGLKNQEPAPRKPAVGGSGTGAVKVC